MEERAQPASVASIGASVTRSKPALEAFVPLRERLFRRALARALRGCASVLVAFAGAAYEDLTADSSVLRIASLALIPACYYTFLIYLCVPEAVEYVAARAGRLAIPFVVAVLSLAPVLACCWPERTTPRRMHPDAADA